MPNRAFRDMANAIRALAMDAVEKAKSGHPGMPMGMADVVTIWPRSGDAAADLLAAEGVRPRWSRSPPRNRSRERK